MHFKVKSDKGLEFKVRFDKIPAFFYQELLTKENYCEFFQYNVTCAYVLWFIHC